MITLKKLVVDMQNLVRGGKVSASENISRRQIAHWIHATRAQLIFQDISKRRTISDNITQDIGCVETHSVDASACCGIVVGCSITRTDVKIPNVIETARKDLLTHVGSADLTAPGFTIIPYQRAAFVGNGQFTKLGHYAFMHDNYVYVMGPKSALFKRINIQGVFEDPTEIATFNNCAGEPCYSDDDEYPISAKMVETLKQMILQTNFRVAVPAPVDVTGDGKANPEQVIQA